MNKNKRIYLTLVFALVFGQYNSAYAKNIKAPANLWKGLVAEDTSGADHVYIARVVYNRLQAGLNHGLVALKRKNLDSFVQENVQYVLKVKKVNLEDKAKAAISQAWNGEDIVHGATHYEHTGIYPVPSWASKMLKVMVLHEGTRREITFWR